MAFNGAQNIRVEDGTILKANLPNNEGQLNESHFDLNNVLGNNDGEISDDASLHVTAGNQMGTRLTWGSY
jgi:hypothetical protein